MHLQNYHFLNQNLKLFSSENICRAVKTVTLPAAAGDIPHRIP